MNDLHPFDIKEFIGEHKSVVKRYLKKNTLGVAIPDFQEVPKEWLYRGNDNMIRKGAKREFSFWQKLEYIKCYKSVVYFTEKYVKIMSVDDGIIPFKLYPYQRELLEAYEANRFVINMQCRQSGKTQTTAAYILWFANFHSSKTIGVLANKAAQAREIMQRIQMSFEFLPKFLQAAVQTYNKSSIKFANESEIFTAASSSSSIRGRSLSMCYIDEAAFLRDDMTFYESTYPVISSGKKSRVIITSTPNGTRGLFYKLWKESEAELNSYKRFVVTWDMVPGRDEAWKQEQIGNTSPEQFRQEHDCVFRGSSNSLLSGHTLERLISHEVVDKHGDIEIFEQPKEGHEYLITVDTSRGVGSDYSAFVVFDISDMPYRVVAKYKNNRISPMIYPTIVYNAATHYNEAQVLIEINDIGGQVADILFHDLEYEEIVQVSMEKNRQVMGMGGNPRLGVRTTTAVKSVGCANVKTMIEKGVLELIDHDIIDEFGTFVPKGKSYEADVDCHDDLAMCCVIFAWATTQQYFVDLTDRDARARVMQEAEERAYDEIAPFGMIDSEMGMYDSEVALFEDSMF